jgi:uncharacterized protein (TIGR02001 family)
MKKTLVALAVAAMAVPAAAQEFAFNVGAVTDYRYRGISQSRLKPALQGGIDVTLPAGFYVGTWASTIKWIKDGGGEGDVELDLYGGYKGTVGDVGFDVGVLRYQYPGHDLGISPNTTELYGALTFGPATLKYSHSTTNLFGFDDSKGSGYLDLSATFEVAGLGITPHIGHQKVDGNDDFTYTDYSVTVSKTFGSVVVSGALVGTDTDEYRGRGNKNLGKAGVVLGAKFTF